jgi:hypothetical protein
MTESLRNYTKALCGFDAVIQRVPPDAWDADSPCDGWCARDVVAHACGVMKRRRGHGEDGGERTSRDAGSGR